MRKVLLVLALSTLIFTATLILTACSVNEVKPKIIETVKSALNLKRDLKRDVTTSLLPDQDTSLTIDGKTYTVKKETMDSAKKLIETNTEMETILVDLVGSAVTDENIAVVAYYAEKIGLSLEELLKALQ